MGSCALHGNQRPVIRGSVLTLSCESILWLDCASFDRASDVIDIYRTCTGFYVSEDDTYLTLAGDYRFDEDEYADIMRFPIGSVKTRKKFTVDYSLGSEDPNVELREVKLTRG